ncbi:MAG: GNAT family N-acetyltransferase, partial [Paracoccaceae bacterium]
MLALLKGRYTARLADSAADVLAAKTLRYQCFVSGRPADHGQGIDEDQFDDHCQHMLVEEAGSGALACTYRLMFFANGAQLHRSYAAQSYDLTVLSGYSHPFLELGRFCIAPARTPDADL